MTTNIQDYQRVTFTGVMESGWVGAKAGAFNVLVDGIDSTSIDDDAYFFYNTELANEAIDILTKQGLLGESIGRIPTLVPVPVFSIGVATPTNTRWVIYINGTSCIGLNGGAFNVSSQFGQCVFFHSELEYLTALDILRKQGLLLSSDFILPIPCSVTT